VLPRIWWCATGPLAFLPIHAAGIYELDSNESQISNYVISSYTPTLTTLLERFKSPMSISFSLLSVIQSSAPGALSIPNTKKEMEIIQKRLADRDHVVLEGEAGTRRRVIKGMEECNWLHLACHGIQAPSEPTSSALLLEDGHLTLEEIIKLDLPQAEFAFLSACQTTTGDENLSEEAVHIAGGMLLAGYRSVVATMWSIQDELAPLVTDEFYRHLMEDRKRPDPTKAAEALHVSVQKLRQQPGVRLIDWPLLKVYPTVPISVFNNGVMERRGSNDWCCRIQVEAWILVNCLDLLMSELVYMSSRSVFVDLNKLPVSTDSLPAEAGELAEYTGGRKGVEKTNSKPMGSKLGDMSNTPFFSSIVHVSHRKEILLLAVAW
ncbi:2286_t:CDS:2, partial [Acaulospora colombiana]